MTNCSVFRCKKKSETSNRIKDGVTFHKFPKDPVRRITWIKACGNHVTWVPKRTSTICSEHFEKSLFIAQANNKRKLSGIAVPTLQLFKANPNSIVIEESPTEKQIMDSIEKSPGISQTPNSLKVTLTISSVNEAEGEVEAEKTSSSFIHTTLDSPRKRKLKQMLQQKTKKIKRLQSQNRYLAKKVADLKELLNELSKKNSNY